MKENKREEINLELKNNMNNKEIKKFILDATNNLEDIINFLDEDYQSAIEGIFNALFSLLKNYDQNKSRVQYLIHLLEQLIEVKGIDELKMMLGPITDFNNKISSWQLKDRLSISKPYQQIGELLNQINNKEILALHNEKVKYLSFLIFQDKNLKMIENFLNSTNNILNTRDENGENIFENVLYKYLLLDERNREEISYYYKVILLFVSSKHGKNILKNSKQYFRMIKRTKYAYKEHIIKLMELLDPEFTITLNELEQRYSIKFEFPSIILEEAKRFRLNKKHRYDFTNQDAITIDGKGSTCLDDALYIEKNEDSTYTLYIHIVDIPAYIPANSLTREEGIIRGETLYLSDRNIYLYPKTISDINCSLLPNSIRCTQTSIYILDSNFNVIEDSYKLVKGIINVKHRMTYDEVDNRFKNLSNTKLDDTLLYLSEFANARRKSNKKKELYREFQNALEFDPKKESLKINESIAANIIHEAMILENYSKAKYMKELSLPYIYRKLEFPTEDFIEEQLKRLSKLESNFVNSSEFLYKLKESYAKSQYTTIPSYHAGMNLPYYSHSSSPARRAGDSEGQYMIHDMIFKHNTSDFNLKAWEYRANQVVKHLNEVKKTNETFMSHYNYLTYKRLIKGKN